MIPSAKKTLSFISVWLLIAVLGPMSALAGSLRTIHGHLPDARALARPLGALPGTNSLRLAISLPLHHADALANLLQRLYDPHSPDYHHYLTPAQFTEQFGPTARDYEAVVQFAQSNGLEIVARRESRMLLDVRGKVSDVEKAFHVHMRLYQHPTESRQFHVPDAAPAVDAALPILDVWGLDNYAVPHPALRQAKGKPPKSVPATGSQSNGYYLGSDFRNAYAPGVTLTGAGQTVGVLELDDYYASDIAAYEQLAHYPNVPAITVLCDGAMPPPGDGNPEVSLDIEMAIAMAPQLKAVMVFEAPDTSGTAGWMDILDSMFASNQVKQFSSSWGYTGSPNPNTSFDTEFQKMEAQGQSFFQASGDGDAWINPIWTPGDSPYLTSVGGTTLFMNNAGASYASEQVWNYGNEGSGNGWSPNEPTSSRHTQNDYIGSGGGVSTVYGIPSWQTSVINSTNHGSASARNVPDVAMTADGIWVTYGDGQSTALAGTSCAAPLWAGFMALINQQGAADGNPGAGFINSAIYTLGQGSSYSSAFHDITSGNNTNLQSKNLWTAVAGYDLCTGWGTPNGAGLINALEPLPALVVTPALGFVSTGSFGGPFTATNLNFVLTNAGATPFNWSLANTTLWLSVSPASGALAPGGSAATVSASLTSVATNLAPGAYTGTVVISNLANGGAEFFPFSLTVTKIIPAITWANPSAITYGTALTATQLGATATVPGAFVYSPSSGTVLTAGTHTLSATFTPSNTIDYATTTNSASLTVLTAALTVTASNVSRNFGVANPAFTGSISGVTNGDNITATFSSTATSNSVVGMYSIVPTLVDPNDRRTNYAVTLNDGTLTVNKATPVVHWNTPTAITYGTAIGPSQLDATASTAGLFAYNPSLNTVLNAGTNLLSATFFPTDTEDYNGASGSVNLVVNRALLTVTASNVSQTYGQPIPALAGSITGVTNGDNIAAAFSTGATSNSTVGTYPIMSSLVDPNSRQTNYIVSLNNGTLTIHPATPSLAWATPSPVIYGTVLDSNQLNATANVPGSFVYNPPSNAVPNAGTNVLAVTFTPSDTLDYSNAAASANLVVTPAPLMVTASNASQTYGQATPALTGSITGVTNEDNITAAFNSGTTSNSPAGTYPIVPSLVDPDDRQTNYTVSLTNGTLTITPATPILAWAAPAPVIYGTLLDTNELDALANVPGNFAYSPPAGAAPAPGTNILSVLFTPNDPLDYTTAAANVDLVVSLAPIALNIQLVNNFVVLTWNDPDSVFALQAAPAATGPFTNVSGASSPYTNTVTDTQQFFQLSAPGN